MRETLRGSCLCKSVSYVVDGPAGVFVHCHCETCRKAHGTAFSSILPVKRDLFRWTGGQELLSRYESSPGKFRHFCSTCGSQLLAERAGQPVVMLRMGCLDTPIEGSAKAHIWRSDAASWFDPKVQTPEWQTGAPDN